MKTCVLALTPQGHLLAKKIAAVLPGCDLVASDKKIADTICDLWQKYQGIICIMATGIVVRAIAPLLQSKTCDPCVVVMDQNGQFAISLVSGHLGGGNDLARTVAEHIGARPVITTASDVTGCTALDLWARRNNLLVDNPVSLTKKSAKLVRGTVLRVYSDLVLQQLPPDMVTCPTAEEADIRISWNQETTSETLHCVPKLLYLGVGCNRGTCVEDIERSFLELCETCHLDQRAIAGVASIDLKNDEAGILAFAGKLQVPLQFFSRDALNAVDDVSYSSAVMRAVGAQGVAEPAAILAAAANGAKAELIIRKMKWKDVTLAVAQRMKDRWE